MKKVSILLWKAVAEKYCRDRSKTHSKIKFSWYSIWKFMKWYPHNVFRTNFLPTYRNLLSSYEGISTHRKIRTPIIFRRNYDRGTGQTMLKMSDGTIQNHSFVRVHFPFRTLIWHFINVPRLFIWAGKHFRKPLWGRSHQLKHQFTPPSPLGEFCHKNYKIQSLLWSFYFWNSTAEKHLLLESNEPLFPDCFFLWTELRSFCIAPAFRKEHPFENDIDSEVSFSFQRTS